MANNVLKCVCTYLKLNQLHINLSKCAFMYFRPNLNIYDRMICARSQVYNKAYTLSVNGARAKTFTEHMHLNTQSQSLINTTYLTCIIFVIRSLVELLEILKFHSPIPILEYFKASTRSSNHRLQIPKFILGISEKNYVISVKKLWNTSIGKLLDCRTLSVRPFTNGCQFIIPGSTKNSDLTIPVGLFKKKA